MQMPNINIAMRCCSVDHLLQLDARAACMDCVASCTTRGLAAWRLADGGMQKGEQHEKSDMHPHVRVYRVPSKSLWWVSTVVLGSTMSRKGRWTLRHWERPNRRVTCFAAILHAHA